MAFTQPAAQRPGHQRLTVLAAALSVLAVLVLPPAVAWVVDLAVPDRPVPELPQLTDEAQEVVRLTGASVVGGKVVVAVRPGTGVPALAPSRKVATSSVTGNVAQLDVRGLVPMRPDVAPPSIEDLAPRLTPWVDRVFADVGALALGCLGDPGTDDCSLTLLARHGDDYYRYPGQAPARFFTEGSPMEARTYEAVDGQLVVGRLPESVNGGAVAQVIVSLADHSIVPATVSHGVSRGQVVWWSSRGAHRPVSAAVFDDGGRKLASFLLAGG